MIVATPAFPIALLMGEAEECSMKRKLQDFFFETLLPIAAGFACAIYSYGFTGAIIQFLETQRITWVPHVILGLVVVHLMRRVIAKPRV